MVRNKDISILIVDDENNFAISIREQLKLAGFKIFGIANSYTEAVNKISQLKPELVISDIHLDDENSGFNLAKYFIKTVKIPVILVTNFTTDQNILDRILELYPYGYLAKPIETSQLTFAIHSAMKRFEAEQKLNTFKDKYVNEIKKSITEVISSFDKVQVSSESKSGCDKIKKSILAIDNSLEGMFGDLNKK